VTTLEVSVDFDIWLEELSHSLLATDIATIKRAYEIASAAHAGQTRISGEPFVTHSLAVAKILADFGLGAEAIAAGLLHDVPEDTTVTLEQIKKEFGEKIAELVDGVTKMNEVEGFDRINNPFNSQNRKDVQRAESLRKMFLAMGDDVRVVMIKLADRLHNMRTLSSMPEHKRKRISKRLWRSLRPSPID
jgi:(p)ppGpp synthase/HD superfamily hydrolase